MKSAWAVIIIFLAINESFAWFGLQYVAHNLGWW